MNKNNFIFNAIKNIFIITFNQTIRSKKTLLVLILSCLPVIFLLYYRMELPLYHTPPKLMLNHIMLFYLMFISVLVSLFYGTAVIGDEIDNKTIMYLFTRPIPKYSIIIGKYVSYLVGVFILIVPFILINFLIIATDSDISEDFSTTLDIFSKQLGVIILSLFVYGAIFMFCGAILKYPIVAGLLLAFGWEKIVLIVPGIIRKVSIVHYLISIFPTTIDLNKSMPVISKGTLSDVIPSIITILIIAIIFLILSIITLYKKEYKFE